MARAFRMGIYSNFRDLNLIKPRTPAGVMELLPAEQMTFQRLLDRIRNTFERFGFAPLETPVFELTDTLLTKSGGETERQVYFVQSTGALAEGKTPELALRCDLTVPLARYVAEHERELAFPFRRYQMQRVYRGERQQRGRFREFYQCDIDIIGKDQLSVRYDAELPAVIHAVFKALEIGAFTIQLNNRKLLRGFFNSLNLSDSEQQALILREIDKLDKRGAEAVMATLTGESFGLPATTVQTIMDFVGFRSTSREQALQQLQSLQGQDAELDEGIAELKLVIEQLNMLGVPESDYALSFSIARGLDYYTGTVYETLLDDHPGIGSICSGGRYEDLAGYYTKSKLPGVGISIGLTRLFYQLREAGLLPPSGSSTQVLLALMDERPESAAYNLRLASILRDAGINTETVFEFGKLAKQFKYADKAGIRFVAVVGDEERADGTVTLKDLQTQEQTQVQESQLVTYLQTAVQA